MVSIIIPFKYDSNNRLENLLEILGYLKKHWSFEQVIISEMDTSPKILNLLPGWADYIFAKESRSEWSRSKRINLALPIVKSNIMLILDADLIVDYSCVKLAVEKISKNEIDAVTPFEKVYHYPRALVLEEMQKGEINTNKFCLNENYSRVFIANGGCFITKTSIFKHIRGMNELFIGWGLEDDELINRYIKLGYKYGRVGGIPAIHINHDRTESCEINFQNFDNSLLEKNRGILFTKEEMLDYFGISEKVSLYSQIEKVMPTQDKKLIEMVNKEKASYLNVKNEPYKV